MGGDHPCEQTGCFLHWTAALHRRSSRRNRWRALCALMLTAMCGHGAVAQDVSGYSGAELYKRFCASCHGIAGHGDGPVAAALKSEVPDLTFLVRHEGLPFPAEQVRRIIDGRKIYAAHGVRSMPVWGREFSNAAANEPESKAADTTALIDRLVEYLRSIQRHSVPPTRPTAP
jgi:mono/diheme cytochrome c family protein